ncbi:MAG: hypothetical protein V1691_00895 [Chloroflexota bacterium]
MKRVFIFLSIMAVLAIPVAALAGTSQPAHENPAAAKGMSQAATMLLAYDRAFNLVSAGKYLDARGALNDLEQANIGSELRYIADRYSEICHQLFTSLDSLDSLLTEAAAYLSHSQASEAKARLAAAVTATSEAQYLLEDINSATDSLSHNLGIPATTPAASQLGQARSRLDASLLRVNQLVEELNQLFKTLDEKSAVQLAQLEPTRLSLSTNPTPAFVGDRISVQGRLSSSQPMPQRQLTILLNQELLLTTTTGPDGSYAAAITLPEEAYLPDMTLTAEYIPSGDDTGLYQGSLSRQVPVMFHPTLLEANAPGAAYSGVPFTISGQVSPAGAVEQRAVRILLDDMLLVEAEIAGQFSLKVATPADTSIGEHRLKVSVSPQGRYSGAVQDFIISISKLTLQADIQAPQLLLIPRLLQVSGRAYYQGAGPATDALVKLSFKGVSATASTGADGSFDTYLKSPLDLSLVDTRELALTIEPSEPYYTPGEITQRILTINPSITGLMLFILACLGIMAYNRGRTSPSPQMESAFPGQPGAVPIQAAVHRAAGKPGGSRGRMLSAYRSGLAAVEKATGLSMAPHNTLREFLSIISPRLPGAGRLFAELTAMAEIALYSAISPGDTATRAEQIATAISRELGNGTA